MPAPVPATLADVLAKFPAEVLAKYDFSNAKYTGALTPITGIVCPQHGEFKQYAAQLRRGGSECPSCGGLVRAAKKRSSIEKVIAQANTKHNNFYSYSRAAYVNNQTKFTVTCPHHGDFEISPNGHLAGRGCPTCGTLKRGHRKDPVAAARSTADRKLAEHAARFEVDARAVHGNTYDYSQTVYKGRRSKLTIVCPEHGPFEQRAEHHLARDQGCPECSHHRSKGEAAILMFVSTFVEATSRDRTVVPPKELDIYVPSAKLAIEYCGEYWHAASSVEEERTDRTRHLEKHKACEAKGVRLLTIYESEWLSRSHVIKRLLRSALGKMRGRVAARKCDLRRVGAGDAYNFFERYHPQGGGGYGQNYGLFYGAKLVACMRFTLGANDRGLHADRVWTLSRYATRVSVTGGAERLLKAFIEEFKPDTVKSFSDNRYFTGAMYERLGFELEEESAPDYQVYHPATGLRPKTDWQRRNIPARIRDLRSTETFDPVADHRSERDMTYLLGAQRLFDCGKKRWVLRL